MEVIEHDWARNADGTIDIWQLDEGYHNGPRCVRCGYVFCHHCEPKCWDQPCPNQTPYLF